MIKNYFKTAVRNLKRNKSYTLINVLGLSVGIGASWLIFLVIQFETSFDNFHKKKNSIYRIATTLHSQDGIKYTPGCAFPVGPQLKIDFPQIKQVASIFLRSEHQITVDVGKEQQKKFIEPNFYYAEPEFFEMFDFGWLAGSKQSLKEPTNAILTQAIAEKIFGEWQSALGKTIKVNNKTDYKITGILKNIPPNTDFPLNIVVGHSAIQNGNLKRNLTDWASTFGDAYTFVVLPDGLPLEKFNAQLVTFAKRHKPAEFAADAPIAQPLTEIHYDDRFGNYTGHTFSHQLVDVLALIGIFLLVIACMNFINLATSQAVNRSKEVGVRKVLGSNRWQLAFQFLGETLLITVTAVVLSLFIAEAALPFFNELLETKMKINFISNPMLLGFAAILTVVVTLLSGLYPAIILSGFRPVTALKSKITSKMVGGISLRRALVVLQFAIAQVLIIAMLIVVSQMKYFKNASLGFDKAQVINVPLPHDSASLSKVDYLKNSLLANSSILRVSFSYGSPSDENNWNSNLKFDHSTQPTNFQSNLKWADADYFNLYNLQFVAGHPYSQNDSVSEFVVNETLLNKLGIRDPEDAIGKELNFWNGTKVGSIVGVIKDFNANSLRQPMTPVVLGAWKEVYQRINIKIKTRAEKAVLSYIEKLWNGTFPEYVYNYKFLDASIASFYKQEDELSQLYKIFAAIAIFISCLGLYGLVSFMAVQRTKEMGIRKVLGAAAKNIVYLLSKEFTLLIIIAFGVSAPIAYYFMSRWLNNYAYRVRLDALIFIIAITSSIAIAWITVAQQAIKAAIANPVKSLRTE
jgi:putative ABC transport system permease protein